MTRTRSTHGMVAAALLAALVVPLPGAAAPASDTAVAGPPKGGSRAGVSKRAIVIGMHAPLTGAAPLPSDTADDAKDLFFRWLHANGRDINGRRVRVVLKNDNYNPADAVTACRELVEDDKVFALIGFSGMDQMQSCARYAASARVPYLSPGSTERYMGKLPQTFATSMTWPDESRLLADLMVTKLKAGKRDNAMVWYDTSNLKGTHARFVRSMRKRKAGVYSRSVPTQANTADAHAVIADLVARDIENVFVHVTPIFFIQLLRAADDRNYDAHWTGIDSAYQSDFIAGQICGSRSSAGGSKFLSSYPAVGSRNRFDKAFDRAMNRFHPGEDADTVLWFNWAQQKALARLLRLPGRNLTRKRFVYFVERARKIKTGVGPRLDFRPNDHFGARQAHLNRLDCNDREWRTIKAFVSNF